MFFIDPNACGSALKCAPVFIPFETSAVSMNWEAFKSETG